MATIVEQTESETTGESAATFDSAVKDDAPDTAAKPKRKKKSAAGKLWRSSMMLVRRVHLYSGIFMFPFVLLYGFSGWFFNHPGYFREGTATEFRAADVAGGQLAELPTAEAIAASVVDEMNIESFVIDGPEIKLTDDHMPRFSGFLTFTVNNEKASHAVTINPVDGSGEIKTVPVEPASADESDPPPTNPLAGINSVTLQENPLELARQSVPQVLEDLELSTGEAFTGRRAPSVTFSAEAEGVPCLVTYNLGSGLVTSIREDQRPEMATMDLMRRMHLARMYTPQYDVRWIWALVVDAMFVSMVFWGCSGLFMWWQIKRTRWLGGGVLVASVAFSAFMMMGMHDNLTQGGGRRGGGGGGGGRGASVQPTPPAPQQSIAARPASESIQLP